MERRTLPAMASIAHKIEGAKLHAPSAERNAAVITEVLVEFAPKSGRALEIASGTGQHIVVFAGAMPNLEWQPTEIEPERRASIDAWAKEAGLPNVRPALALNATSPGWGCAQDGQSLIVLINLLHLVSAPEAQTLIAEVSQALVADGRFFLYGPFLRSGQTTSEGDARFHASLVGQNPEIGYKDLDEVVVWIEATGLSVIERRTMPANNIMLIAQRPA